MRENKQLSETVVFPILRVWIRLDLYVLEKS